MTENSSNQDIGRKIQTQKDEEQNYFIVEEIDEIENPLELDHGDLDDCDISMEATTDPGDSSEDGNSIMHSLPSSRNKTIVRSSWGYQETKKMLTIFIEHKRHLDRLKKVKNIYNFIATKLNDLNPDHPTSASAVESEVKSLIRTYRANRGLFSNSRSKSVLGRPKTDIDCDLEIFFGKDRLMKGVDVKSEIIQNSFEVGESINASNTSLLTTTTEPNVLEKMGILRNTEAPTRANRLQHQSTQTDLGANMLKQLVQIEMNQQKRWDEEKALIARIELAKTERFTRKESLLQDLVNVLKLKLR